MLTSVQISKKVNATTGALGGETASVLPVPYPPLDVTVAGTWRVARMSINACIYGRQRRDAKYGFSGATPMAFMGLRSARTAKGW